ncbi:MAG: hypothetical protein PHW31_03990 [Candidatus Pacebacteria bacterium]|nr:hypothetical protein [Candidatus Paceibacterota bacterium]
MGVKEAQTKKIKWSRYLLVFLATLMIFGAGFFLSNMIVEKKISALAKLQQGFSIDILSLETQFSVLNQAPCKNLNESTLTKELFDISQKLESVGNSLGKDNPDFLMLKKYYSILEIKHWLLLKKAAKDCKMNVVSIAYFYADKKNCPDCEDQGYILTTLREKYPFLRVYSFDYNLPLAPLETIKSIYRLKPELPVLVINDDEYYGSKSKEELEETLSQYIDLKKLELKTATSTQTTTTKVNSK